MKRENIHTDEAPKALGPYVQAVKTGNMIFTSGQLGIDPATDTLTEGVEQQAHQAMKNLEKVLKKAGADFRHVVKSTIFLADLADFAMVNGIYESYFSGTFPARSCVQVAKLPKDARVEIELIAVVE